MDSIEWTDICKGDAFETASGVQHASDEALQRIGWGTLQQLPRYLVLGPPVKILEPLQQRPEISASSWHGKDKKQRGLCGSS